MKNRAASKMPRPQKLERTRRYRDRKPALPGIWAVYRLVSLTLVFSLVLSLASGQSVGSSEYDIKAAFLFHFAQFVEWPPQAFKDQGSPVTYCTIGDDPFHGTLDKTLAGKTIGMRPLRVQHFKAGQEIQTCQILFLGLDLKKPVAATLESLSPDPVLTVGDSEHFVQEGGMIGFLLEDNKVRFEINLEAAERSNLKISARLLSLAKKVITRSKEN
jgi:YfiR/HmsC-like